MRDRKKILIVLIAGIGDVVLASKSIRAVRNGWPSAEIHLLTSTEGAEIASHYMYLDHVWAFPIREIRKRKTYVFNMLKTVLTLRKLEFDSCLNIYRVCSWIGAVKMGFLFLAVKAQDKIGQDSRGFGLFLNKKASAETFEDRHLAEAMIDIACLAGGRPDGMGVDAFWNQKSEKKWQHLFPVESNLSCRPKIGLNPGGDRQNRRWSSGNYAEVANQLSELYGAQIILLGGPGEEAISRKIEVQIGNSPINLAGKMSIDELTYVISKMDLLISNDSGPMHIAAAVETPVVGIFGPENENLFAPYTRTEFFRIISKKVDCRPCSKNECFQPACLNQITPEDVAEQCRELLEPNNV
jgi:heptosyltransferase-2